MAKEKVRGKYNISMEEYWKKLKQKGYDKEGKQVPDGTPMAPPVGYTEPPSMVQIVRDMVQSEGLRKAMMDQGMETLEEADDFMVGDDQDELYSGYENDLDVPISELLEAGREEILRRRAEESASNGEPTPPAAPPEPAPPTDGPEPSSGD